MESSTGIETLPSVCRTLKFDTPAFTGNFASSDWTSAEMSMNSIESIALLFLEAKEEQPRIPLLK